MLIIKQFKNEKYFHWFIQWYFLDHDQGEPDIASDPLWQEDTGLFNLFEVKF